MTAPRAVHVLLLGAGLVSSLAAQNPTPPPPVVALPGSGAKPLTKTALIRLLTSGSLTNKQIALQVRRNCLTFTPSDRDREDLVNSTADTAVMRAVAACGRPGGTLRIVAPAVVRAVTGSEVTIAVRVLRWDVPVPGASLELLGASEIPGGPTQNPGAGTDARGVARLRLAVGMQVAQRELRVVLASGSDNPRATIRLVTAPPAVARALVQPGVVVFRGGVRSAASIAVTLVDSAGRPVPGVPVELAGTTSEISRVTGPATDAAGHTTLTLSSDSVGRSGRAGVYAAGQLVGTLNVVLLQVVVSEDRTEFIAGANQRGVVHQAARSPLVLEVRDTAGRPVRDYPVRFGVVNGALQPAELYTDSSGQARVRVTLGDRTGTVVIRASVGGVSRQALMYATPGAPQTLVVEQGGVAVQALVLVGRDSLVLRVAARDAYSNDVSLTDLSAAFAGAGAPLSVSRRAAPGVLVLEPRSSGSGVLVVTGSGVVDSLPIHVTLPPIVTGPWSFDVRAGGVAFNYGFRAFPLVAGRPGFRGELAAGRAVAPALRVGAALGFGVLGARAHSAALSVGLSQLLVRGEFLLSQSAQVQPVLEAGTGIYRLKSSDPTNTVYHTSWLYLFGAGVNYPLAPRLIGTVRLERQQLVEANSRYANGAVGALTIFEVGVRLKQ